MAFSPTSGVNVAPSQNFSDYNRTSSTVAGPSPSEGWSLQRAKRAYTDYLDTKRAEIDEQQDARRYRHGSQWTAKEIQQLNLRKQPVVTINKVSRKIHGVVGVVGRLKQDPKAFPRTPMHEQGAELATSAVRYVLQSANFGQIDPACTEMAGVDGIGGIEFTLIQGDHGDPDIGMEIVHIEDFFYDPTSRESDFSDCNYLGVARWYSLDKAKDDFPEYADEFDSYSESGSEMSTNSDQEQKWFLADANRKRIRIVKCWYKKGQEWRWKLFTGYFEIDDQPSFCFDEKGRSTHQYEMFSAYTDQDGDRYGFVRDLKPMQTEVNMRRSKALHIMAARRIIAPQGAFDDIEVARREASRADGVVVYNETGTAPQFDDQARNAETQAQLEFLKGVNQEIETFGPNVALTQGTGLDNSSGRAINLLQQAGLADLGPFLQAYRGWKIRVYRKIWNLVQRYWTSERWIRVTDDQQLAQFVQINGVGIDPQTGLPTLVNALGQLDVDIILDEGPDEVNAMGDAYDTLSVLATKSSGIPPELAKQWLEIQLELAPIPASIKQRCIAKLNPQPTPEDMQKQQLQQRGAIADVTEKENSAKLKDAQAFRTLVEAGQPQGEQAQPQAPIDPEMMKVAQSAKQHDDKMALEKYKADQNAQLEREKMQMEAQHRHNEMQMQAHMQAQQQQQKAAEPKSEGVKLSLDGSIGDIVKKHADENAQGLSAIGAAMVKAAQSLEKNTQAMADAVNTMTKASQAPRRIVRDKSGRASHVEIG